MKFKPVITALLTLALAALFSGAAFAQTTPVATPRNAVAYVGGSYNPAGSPQAVLNLGGFYPVMADDKLYVGAALDIAFKPNSQPKIVIRPEALPRLYTLQVNNFTLPIYGIVGLGAQIEPTDPVATLANLKAAVGNVGTDYGINAAIGVTTSVHIARSLYLSPSFRWVGGDGKPARIVGVGVAWKFTVGGRK